MEAGFEVIGSKSGAPEFRRALFDVASKCRANYGFPVPPVAVEFVGKQLIAGEKAVGVHNPEFQNMPPFRHTARPDLPPLEPDPIPILTP